MRMEPERDGAFFRRDKYTQGSWYLYFCIPNQPPTTFLYTHEWEGYHCGVFCSSRLTFFLFSYPSTSSTAINSVRADSSILVLPCGVERGAFLPLILRTSRWHSMRLGWHGDTGWHHHVSPHPPYHHSFAAIVFHLSHPCSMLHRIVKIHSAPRKICGNCCWFIYESNRYA